MILRIFLLAMLPIACFGQNQFRFENFSIKDGLSQNTVNCTYKDSEGNYWFGTQDGLNKYDGNTVKIFRHNKDDSTTISDNFILNIQEDSNRNLWIGTRNGFNFYDRKTDKFSKILVNEKEKASYHNCIYLVFIDNNQNIFFNNSYGQLCEIQNENRFAPPFHPVVIKNNVTVFMISDSTYCLLDSLRQKIKAYSLKNNKFKWEIESKLFINLTNLVETSDGKVLFIISNEVYLIENKKQIEKVSKIIPGVNINSLLEDSQYNIWMGGNEGLYFFRKGDFHTSPVLLLHNSENRSSLSSNNVQSIYKDKDGLIWIGTSEGGVNIFDPNEICFNYFNHFSDISLSANTVWGIFQDKNELWVGTNTGLNHLVFQNENISKTFTDLNKLVYSEVIKKSEQNKNSICSNVITCIEKDKQGMLWFGSHDGISVYNPLNKQWKQLNMKNTPMKTDVVFHLLCTTDGRMWISTMVGFYCYDPVLNQFKSFLSIPNEKNGFPSGYIISIFEDKENTIWVASTGGVYHLKGNGERIAVYKSETNNPKSLSYNIVTSFCQDSKGRLWIATLGGGINLFDKKSESFKSFTIHDGLSNDITYRILEDKTGNLWISTNYGISCYNTEKNTFVNYTEKEGLIANEFSQNSGTVNNTGDMLFGSPEGLVVFNSLDFNENLSVQSHVIISSLEINYVEQNYLSGSDIDLYYNDKTISFQFTSPDFRNKDRIRYAYQLEGFDNGWHEISTSNRIASYTNLPFGKYIFKVKIRIGNEEWQENELKINLNVISPFWLSSWFIFLEIILFILVVVILVRYYSQRKLRKKLQKIELQQKIFLERERISRDLHDNVGSHLTYIITTLDNISYKMEKGEKTVSQEKINSLSDFSRSTMHELRESIWALSKENILLEELKDKISEYASRMASISNMDFDIYFNSNNEFVLKPSHAINIYRIIQEAVNNSVKHSEAQSLVITISESLNSSVIIEIKDDGKGMNEDEIVNGYGLKNMRDRVKDICGEFALNSNDGGTIISIKIPA